MPNHLAGRCITAMVALRFRFAPPAVDHGAGGDNALTINPDHSEGADRTAGPIRE